MVCLPRETIFIALSGHGWVSIKDSFSSHNRVLCFGFEYKRLHSAGGKKISVPCLKLHKDDSDTQKGSLVSSDPPRLGLSLIYAKQITDVPGDLPSLVQNLALVLVSTSVSHFC